MIEDKTHLALLNEIATELERLVVTFNARASGITERGQLMALRLEQNELLAEMVHRHRRALDYAAGRPVPPQVHFAETVLHGEGKGAM